MNLFDALELYGNQPIPKCVLHTLLHNAEFGYLLEESE